MKKIVITIIGLGILSVAVFLFAFVARQGEYAAVRTVSDFYVAQLAPLGASRIHPYTYTTDRFSAILQEVSIQGTVTCGVAVPDQIHIGDGAVFWNDGTVKVSFSKNEVLYTARIALKKDKGVWRIDAIACTSLL